MSNTDSVNWKDQRIIITGGSGFLGKHIIKSLHSRGVADNQIVIPRSAQYDLTEKDAVVSLYNDCFAADRATMIIHLAAEVGGIGANMKNPGRYFYANMAMAMHLIEQARVDGLIERNGKFIQTGTICAYPNLTPIPFKEENLWNGYPETTNAPYGIAKKAAWQMLDAYKNQYGMKSVFVLPVNLYGPHDNFNLESSHVIPALIRKCVEALERNDDHLPVWGTGSASREFLYIEDCAEGLLTAAEKMDDPTPINLGTNMEITIKDLVHLIAKLTGFCQDDTELESKIQWDPTKPDGQPRRCLDVQRAKDLLDWNAKVTFEQGLRQTIDWFTQNQSNPDSRM